MRAYSGLAFYILVSFGLAYLLDYTVILSVMDNSGGVAGTLLLLALLVVRMATPTLGALLAFSLNKDSRGMEGFKDYVLLRPPKGNVWDRALFLPALLVLLAYALGSLPLLALRRFTVCNYLSSMGWVAGPLILMLVLAGILAGVTINMIVALLEEIGWRGYMYQALKHYGIPRVLAALLVGVTWGLWHAPLIMSGYNFRIPVPEPCGGSAASGLVALAVFTVYTTAAGILLSLMVERYGSIYSAVAGHGAINGLAGVFSFIIVGPRLIAPPAGLAVATGFVVVAILTSLYASTASRGRD